MVLAAHGMCPPIRDRDFSGSSPFLVMKSWTSAMNLTTSLICWSSRLPGILMLEAENTIIVLTIMTTDLGFILTLLSSLHS